MLKRIFAIFLCVVIALPIFASCQSDGGVPDGMHSVTLDGEPFIFYVPETWTNNSDAGISSAYYSFTQGIMATAKYFALDKETYDAGVKSYVEGIEAQNAASLKLNGYSKTDLSESRINEKLAYKYAYTYNREDDAGVAYNLTVIQYYTFHADGLVLLSLYVATEHYNSAVSDFDKIKNNFVLCDRTVSTKEETDDYTPEGMKKASSDDVQYACYVPNTWKTNLDTKDTFAYYYDSENPNIKNPNVSVTCFSPDKDYRVAEFYELIELEYKKAGYKFVAEDPQKITVAERDSVSFDYTIEQGGVTYKLRQIIIGYNSLMYSITYTATEDVFEDYLEDLQKIVDSFRFR